MKTQEEIEQLAIKWYTEKHEVVPKIIETESFIYGYQQCQEDIDKDYYWSSREYCNNYAWYFAFSTGDAYYYFKYGTYYVRAVRDLINKQD